MPSFLESTLESTLDQTSNTIDTTADNSKLDDVANETNGDDDNEDIDDGNDNSEIDANSIVDQNESLAKTAKLDTLQTIDDNVSTPSAPTTVATATAVPVVVAATPPAVKSDVKNEDKNISRSGRVIKRTKYLLEELEDSPAGQPIKRKRPLDSPATVQKRRKSDDGSGENGTLMILAHGTIHLLNKEKKKKKSKFCRFSEPEQVHDCRRLLEIENMLLKYDLDIKASLQLSSADPAKCLSVLEDYKSLNVTALMLKKNPSTVETVKRLRRYVGNIKDWNFDETQRAEFDEKASKIRKLAEMIYKNFKVIHEHQWCSADLKRF